MTTTTSATAEAHEADHTVVSATIRYSVDREDIVVCDPDTCAIESVTDVPSEQVVTLTARGRGKTVQTTFSVFPNGALPAGIFTSDFSSEFE
jgi:hypothetical protein